MTGIILVNGNVRRETDFIQEQAARILLPRHADADIARSKRTLLVTAAWGYDEHREGHVKDALTAIGIPPAFSRDTGHDEARQNLSLFHEREALFATAPEIRTRWEAKERVARTLRDFSGDEAKSALTRFRRALALAKQHAPALRVADLVRAGSGELSPALDEQGLLRRCLTRELSSDLERIRTTDERALATLRELDAYAEREGGFAFHPLWQAARARLESRILGSASIFLFGGDVHLLADALRLFRLGEVLAEALRRGTSLYTVSAGSLVLCDRLILYHQHEGAEFELSGRGTGLVRALQLFPHCEERVQTDDPDNLAYLAFRFHDRACAGLNEGSYLLLEPLGGGELRATSVGQRDGVYVFGRDGTKRRYDEGEIIPLGEAGSGLAPTVSLHGVRQSRFLALGAASGSALRGWQERLHRLAETRAPGARARRLRIEPYEAGGPPGVEALAIE